MERIKNGMTILQTGLLLIAMLVTGGCFEDNPSPSKPKEAPVKNGSQPAPVYNPVADHWAAKGEQAFAGKTYSTWWELGGAPSQFFQKAGACVKMQWPGSGFAQTDAATARYRIPITTNAFGEVRYAEVILAAVSPEKGAPRAEFKVSLRAEDLAETSKVAQQEAMRLYKATASGEVQNPVVNTPVVAQIIPDKRYEPEWVDGRLDYGFPDDVLKNITGDYYGCRYGVPFTKPDAYGQFEYNQDGTPNPTNQLFMLVKKDYRRSNAKFKYSCGKASATGAIGDLSDTAPDVYRKFNFPRELADLKQHGKVKANGARNLVILINGWNPPECGYELKSRFGFKEWNKLDQNLWKALPENWGLVEYNWAIDAATGPLFENGLKNPSESAAIGHLHGWHLGELLQEKQPRLQKVHFIAHSAGAWVARNATLYILKNMPDVQIQVTLLDPFIPNSGNFLTCRMMDELVNGLGERIFRLENYYVKYDATFGWTANNFNWTRSPYNPDLCINEQIDIPQQCRTTTDDSFLLPRISYKCDLTPEQALQYHAFLDGHSKPIQFYADTIAGEVKAQSLQKYGWPKSMAAEEILRNKSGK